MAKVLVSFDIDGTLTIGDPPGVVSLDYIHRAKELGYVIGSASDRVVSQQRRIWDSHGIVMDFVSHKQHLDQVKRDFSLVRRFIHIGDTHVDEHFATLHGFEFYLPEALPADGSDDWVF